MPALELRPVRTAVPPAASTRRLGGATCHRITTTPASSERSRPDRPPRRRVLPRCPRHARLGPSSMPQPYAATLVPVRSAVNGQPTERLVPLACRPPRWWSCGDLTTWPSAPIGCIRWVEWRAPQIYHGWHVAPHLRRPGIGRVFSGGLRSSRSRPDSLGEPAGGTVSRAPIVEKDPAGRETRDGRQLVGARPMSDGGGHEGRSSAPRFARSASIPARPAVRPKATSRRASGQLGEPMATAVAMAREPGQPTHACRPLCPAPSAPRGQAMPTPVQLTPQPTGRPSDAGWVKCPGCGWLIYNRPAC